MKLRSISLLLICLLFIIIPSAALSLSVDASWDEVTEDIENAPENIMGYFIYYDDQSRGEETINTAPNAYYNRINTGNSTSIRLNDLEDGITYYFAVTAYDNQGNESEFSEEIVLSSGSSKTSVSGGCGTVGHSNSESCLLLVLLSILICVPLGTRYLLVV